MGLFRRGMETGCTKARHQRLGVHVGINARAGEQWRNDDTLDEIDMQRDGQAIKDRIQHRIILRNVTSKWFRKHRKRIEHLLWDPADD